MSGMLLLNVHRKARERGLSDPKRITHVLSAD